MNISICIFENNFANENNAKVFSADTFSTEVVVIICPCRVETRGKGSNMAWGSTDLESSQPSLKQFQCILEQNKIIESEVGRINIEYNYY